MIFVGIKKVVYNETMSGKPSKKKKKKKKRREGRIKKKKGKGGRHVFLN